MRTWQLEVINEDEKVDQKQDTPGNVKRAQFLYQRIKKSPWEINAALDYFCNKCLFFIILLHKPNTTWRMSYLLNYMVLSKKFYLPPSQHGSNLCSF